MEEKNRVTEKIVVIDSKGANESAARVPSALCDRLYDSINRGERSILLDMSQVSYADSMLLGALVQAYVSAIRRGATVRLLHVSDRFRRLLAITKLDKVLLPTESAEPPAGTGIKS